MDLEEGCVTCSQLEPFRGLTTNNDRALPYEHTLVKVCGLTDGGKVGLGNPQIPVTCDVLPQEVDNHPNPHSGCQQGPVGWTCILGVKTLRVGASESRNHTAETRGGEGKGGLAKG